MIILRDRLVPSRLSRESHPDCRATSKFKHSWPLFRRHVALTARRMTAGTDDLAPLDSAEASALNYSGRPRYLDKGYWRAINGPSLYYGSLDLEKFYPSIKSQAILRGFEDHLSDYASDPWVRSLLASLLKFEV